MPVAATIVIWGPEKLHRIGLAHSETVTPITAALSGTQIR